MRTFPRGYRVTQLFVRQFPHCNVLLLPLAIIGSALLAGCSSAPEGVDGEQPIVDLHTHTNPVFSLVFSPDNTVLATGGGVWDPSDDNPAGCSQGAVILWHTNERRMKIRLSDHDQVPAYPVTMVAYNADGSELVSAGATADYHFVGDSTQGRQPDRIISSASNIIYWDIERSSFFLSTGNNIPDHEIIRRHLADRNLVKLSQAACKPHSTTVAATDTKAGVELTASTRPDIFPRKTGSGPKVLATCLAFHPSGNSLASAGGPDKAVHWWEPVQDQEPKVLAFLKHEAIVTRVAFPGKNTLAALDESGVLKLWNLETQKENHTIQAHQGDAFAMAVSPDGKIVATGGVDKAIKLWDTATGKELASRPNQKGRIQALAFSPDGKRLASSACDPFEKGEVKLWETAELTKK